VSPEAFLEVLASAAEWAADQWELSPTEFIAILLAYQSGKSEHTAWVENELIPYLSNQ